MQKHIQLNKDERHSSFEKYTPQFIWKGSKRLLKVLLCERWVGDWIELQHIDPHSAFLSRSSGLLNRGPGGQPLWDKVLIPASSLQLQLFNRGLRAPSTGCWFSLPHLISNSSDLQLQLTSGLHPGNIIVRHLPSSCGRHKSHSFNPSTVKVISRYSSTGYTCYLHRCISYFDSLAGVGGQYTTLLTFMPGRINSLHHTIFFQWISRPVLRYIMPVYASGSGSVDGKITCMHYSHMSSARPSNRRLMEFFHLCTIYWNSILQVNYRFHQSIKQQNRCPWCNGYRRRKWTRQLEFTSWTRLIAFHIALIPLGKVWIQLFSLQLWVNSRTD